MAPTVKIERNIFAEKGARDGIVRSMTEVLIRITNEAKVLCPVDKGQLANSISYKIDGGEDGFNSGKLYGIPAKSTDRLTVQDKGRTANKDQVYIGYSGTNSDHWFPEFGTRYQVAQPFLRPAKSKVVDGLGAAEIGKRYGRAAMEEAYRKRKVVK